MCKGVKAGYTDPKPLIPIFGKPMILHVLDHLHLSLEDRVFIFYYNLSASLFEQCILDHYPNVSFVRLTKQTLGAAETIYLGLRDVLSNHPDCSNRKTMLFDCDAFYGNDVVSMFRDHPIDHGAVYSLEFMLFASIDKYIPTDPIPIDVLLLCSYYFNILFIIFVYT